MKYLVTLFIIPFLVLSCAHKAENTKPEEKQVLVKTNIYSLNGSSQIETLYELSEGDCRVAWQANRNSSDQKNEVQLKDRTVCRRNFSEIVRLHNRVIERLIRDYAPTLITSVATGGLKSLQPDGSWNEIIAKAARTSKDYLDFKKKYRHRTSKKSVNAIFVDLMLQTQPHVPFKQMLASHGLNFELDSVEKVFTSKSSSGETVIDDAGMFWWKSN